MIDTVPGRAWRYLVSSSRYVNDNAEKSDVTVEIVLVFRTWWISQDCSLGIWVLINACLDKKKNHTDVVSLMPPMSPWHWRVTAGIRHMFSLTTGTCQRCPTAPVQHFRFYSNDCFSIPKYIFTYLSDDQIKQYLWQWSPKSPSFVC